VDDDQTSGPMSALRRLSKDVSEREPMGLLPAEMISYLILQSNQVWRPAIHLHNNPIVATTLSFSSNPTKGRLVMLHPFCVVQLANGGASGVGRLAAPHNGFNF